MAKKSKMKRKSNGKSASKSTRTKKTASRTTYKAAAKKTTMSQVKLPSSYREPLSKSAMIKAITEATCLGKKDVVAVLDCLTEVIEKHVKPGCAGKFVMPGLMKITVVKKPARSARKGINPFTGEEIMIKARPAYKAVKIKALKQLKEMVS